MAKLYVGNLNFDATEEDLKQFFAEVTPVDRATVIRDKFTNQSRGFGFVEINDAAKASEAISTLNGRVMKGRTVKVNEARPQEARSPGGGGGGGGGGRGRRF